MKRMKSYLFRMLMRKNELTVEILKNTVFRTLTEAPPEEQKRETLMRETGADDEEEKEEVQEKPKV